VGNFIASNIFYAEKEC